MSADVSAEGVNQVEMRDVRFPSEVHLGRFPSEVHFEGLAGHTVSGSVRSTAASGQRPDARRADIARRTNLGEATPADPAPLSPEERERLVEHEVQAMQRLRAQGGIVVGAGGTATLWPLRDPDA